jgi:hypothetical protein
MRGGAIVTKIRDSSICPWRRHHCLIFFDVSYALTLSMAETSDYGLRHNCLRMGLVRSWPRFIWIFILNLGSVSHRDIARIPELREAVLTNVFASGISSAVRYAPVVAHVDPILLGPPIYPHSLGCALCRVEIVLQIVVARARSSLKSGKF